MKSSAKSAFTLIELLVVIAIIAILASLAMQGIFSSIEKARALTDSNQLKTLGEIFERYLTDHDDALPSLSGAGAGTAWPEQFHKITTDYKIFLSPFDKRPVQTTSSSPCSYGINNNVFGLDRWEINSPSELIMMAPVATVGGNLKPVFTGVASTNVTLQPTSTHGTYKITKNGSYLNALYADWHVVPMNYSPDFTDTSSTAGQRHWNPKYEDTQ